MLDGNHRLAAASLRGDPSILAIVSGDLDYALELFGVECQEPQEAYARVNESITSMFSKLGNPTSVG